MASVKVAVRVRPFNRREEQLHSKLIVGVEGNTICLDAVAPSSSATSSSLSSSSSWSSMAPVASSTPVGRPHKFTFDYSYWSHARGDAHFAGQNRVYEDLGTDVVDNAFLGYNACVFAYGQTGSGKTYTMMGDSGEERERGLIPRICQSMFDKMKSGKQEGTTYRTEVSYLEIYNEKVKDLLRNNSEHKLRVREHPQTGPYVEDLSKHLVVDYDEIRLLMDEGNKIRTTASTNMNDTSSRSHAIFTITFVNAYFSQGVPHETVSKIHLVDLAGSERADATGATGQRLKEGAHINKSLVTLGSVISALAEASVSNEGATKKKTFIPYRDSVLTWLLKDSLGGNSKTIMIATISPAEINHGETLSTLRYANRAKNIINKPHVNEDPNVRLIRDLREEIERLRSMMSLDPVTLSTVQKQLAVKEAQERHLTEEWTEKWKEAATILKEQEALALKRTGLGVILDSDKPHLVGIDEDVMATGITLYHLKDGDTSIGTHDSSPDIVLKGPSVEQMHCRIHLDANGNATLYPSQGALCMVNASLVSEPTKLSQGCVVVLGKTNMFRFNDPKEAESMRLLQKSMTSSTEQTAGDESAVNRSLLSQSLSDLRNTPVRAQSVVRDLSGDKMHASDGDIKSRKTSMSSSMSAMSPGESGPELLGSDKNTMEEVEEEEETDVNMRSSTTSEMGSSCCGGDLNGGEHLSTSNSKMQELYKSISAQKNVIMTCLESEQCDVNSLNKQISILKEMQDRYSKLEYQLTRNLWIRSHAASGALSGAEGEDPEATMRSFDEQFSALVEQEVDRRMFQEKVLREESDFHDKEIIKMNRDRELEEIRRQHEKEIYLLKRRLHEANAARTTQQTSSAASAATTVAPPSVIIPAFTRSAVGGYVEYEVRVSTQDGSVWSVHRRFRRFRDLHVMMCQTYGSPIQTLTFPSRRLFGSASDTVSLERQRSLQAYLVQLIRVCSDIPTCPLHGRADKEALINFSYFFEPSSDTP